LLSLRNHLPLHPAPTFSYKLQGQSDREQQWNNQCVWLGQGGAMGGGGGGCVGDRR